VSHTGYSEVFTTVFMSDVLKNLTIH